MNVKIIQNLPMSYTLATQLIEVLKIFRDTADIFDRDQVVDELAEGNYDPFTYHLMFSLLQLDGLIGYNTRKLEEADINKVIGEISKAFR